MKLPKYVSENVDRHGNVRYYVRRNGSYLGRINHLPGTPEFHDVYVLILANAIASHARPINQTSKITRNSFSWLCQQYYGSAAFKSLADVTRNDRRVRLDRLCQKLGTFRFKLIRRKNIIRLRDELADRPEAANHRLKDFKALFAWAVELGYLDSNPARDIGKLASKNPDGYHTWTLAETEQFESHHAVGTRARLAYALMRYTGVRKSDVVKLGPQHEQRDEDGQEYLVFIETKGAGRRPKHRTIPILPELREIIDKTSSGHLSYLITEWGKPFTANGFGNWFRDRCDEAGLKQCTSHGIRKFDATTAAENGATDRQLMNMFAWVKPDQANVYTKSIDSKSMAKATIHLLRSTQKGNKTVTPKNAKSSGVTKRDKKA